MKQAEIEEIADFIDETTELVVGWNYDASSLRAELAKLHKIIGQLMQAGAQTKEPEMKTVLADLETKARNCRKLIFRQSLMPH